MEELEDVIKNTKEQRKRRKRKIEHMQQVFHEIMLKTKGQGFYDFTEKTLGWLNEQKINNGILNINILHTSASLVIQENADPDVLYDLKNLKVF